MKKMVAMFVVLGLVWIVSATTRINLRTGHISVAGDVSLFPSAKAAGVAFGKQPIFIMDTGVHSMGIVDVNGDDIFDLYALIQQTSVRPSAAAQ